MNLSSTQSQLLILPPARAETPRIFRNIERDLHLHDRLLAAMQRFRGEIYLRDGAIQADELTGDGRHRLAVDEASWHVLTLDERGRISGCLRYLEEKKALHFEELWIRHAALAHSGAWSDKFRQAVQSEMTLARQKQFSFGEVGGWAVAECRRWTTDPLRMVLAACALFRLLGGCIGVATATVRHGSAAILRRIGLTPLVVGGEELPSYFDPQYRCQMEALRFDSDFPNPKYARAISSLSAELAQVPVICRGIPAREWHVAMRELEVPARGSGRLPVLLPAAG